MKTLSQLRALAASTVGASVCPFQNMVRVSSYAASCWVVVFLFPPRYVHNAFSFCRAAGRSRVSRSAGGFWNVCVPLPSPDVPEWSPAFPAWTRKARLCRIESGWRFAEELAQPARGESQAHAQETYRAWRKGYSSGLRPAGFPA